MIESSGCEEDRVAPKEGSQHLNCRVGEAMRSSNVKFRLNNSELWGGLFGLALGVFVIWSGLKLKLGTINDPGSGYVLFYTGILMCAVRRHDHRRGRSPRAARPSASRWEDTRWTKPLLVIACLTAFSFALDPLGFLLSLDPADAAADAR